MQMKCHSSPAPTKFGLLTRACAISIAFLCTCTGVDGHFAIGAGLHKHSGIGTASQQYFSYPYVSASLTEQEREQLARIQKEKPSIELVIQFDFDSALPSQSSRPSIERLGRALSSPDLKGFIFVIAGYTDGLEDEAYSQRLSERRAETIKRKLVESYNIPQEDLVTVGYGSSKLKVPMNPFDRANNRVEILNMGAYDQH
jgi:outer membrane protein OmpA-like peptidoglycan-associated protein